MLPIRRRLYQSLAGFTPRQLFAALQGAWLEPTPGTIWQENTGITPTTTGGQTIGLLLDQSQGAVLGPNIYVLRPDAYFDSTDTTGSWTASSGVKSLDFVAVTANATYKIESVGGASDRFRIQFLLTTGTYFYDTAQSIFSGTIESPRYVKTPSNAAQMRIYYASPSSTASALSVREVLGAHAAQSTANQRPLLGRRYNLLTYSEDFGNAAWSRQQLGTGSSPAVTQNYAAAPDGTTTAARIILDRGAGTTASDYSYISQRPSVVVGSSYTGTFWVKLTSGSTPITIQAGDGGTFNNVTVTSSWQQITNTIITNGGTRGIGIINIGNVGAAQSADILVWHPDYRLTADVGKDPAYQRITTATDYDVGQYPAAVHDATDSLVVSLPSINVRRNLLTYSEQFDNEAWIKFANAALVSGNTVFSPDGTLTAEKLIAGTSSSNQVIRQSPTSAAGTYTFSCYMKNGGYNQGSLTVWDNIAGRFATVLFNLTNGTITTGTVGNGGNSGIANLSGASVSVQNGWFRCRISFTTTSTTINVYPGVYNATTFGGTGLPTQWAGDGTSGIYIWGAQLELGSTATDYQRVTDWTSEAYSSNGSVYFSTPVGMSALHNQSMGTSYTLPALSTDIYSWIVVPQRLSTAQEGRLARWMERKAGIAGPDYLLDSSNNQLTADDGEQILLAQ